jgi:ABC transporter substrate binding protein
MNRRAFVTMLGGAAAWPCTVAAQISTRRPLIAFLAGPSPSRAARYVDGFMLGLREHGYVEGREINVVFRYADGDLTRLSTLVDELFQLQPNVFVTGSSASALAVRRITADIPIICAALTDPVGVGLVESHARPGSNVTGVLNNLEMSGQNPSTATNPMPLALLLHMFRVLRATHQGCLQLDWRVGRRSSVLRCPAPTATRAVLMSAPVIQKSWPESLGTLRARGTRTV